MKYVGDFRRRRRLSPHGSLDIRLSTRSDNKKGFSLARIFAVEERGRPLHAHGRDIKALRDLPATTPAGVCSSEQIICDGTRRMVNLILIWKEQGTRALDLKCSTRWCYAREWGEDTASLHLSCGRLSAHPYSPTSTVRCSKELIVAC